MKPLRLRRIFNKGRMNLDVDNRELANGEYREAMNALVHNSDKGNGSAVTKAYSNKRLTNLNLGANPIALGSYSYEARDKMYWAVKSDSGCFIVEWDNIAQTAAFVLQDTRPVGERVLDLREGFTFTGWDIITSDDPDKELMLLTDNNLPPLCFNINRAKGYGVNGFDKEDIWLIKKPPRFAPTALPTYTGGQENYMEYEFLSFSYRYKYLDGEYSALSDYTNYQFGPSQFELDYQSLENLGMVNQFNAVRLGFNTGDKRVTDIQIVVKKSNDNTLRIIETFNKENEGWDDNATQSYLFSNDKKYLALPLKELYRACDYVPQKAKGQTVIGNRPVYGNYLEGYDMIDGNRRKIRPDFSLSILSSDISGEELPVVIATGGGPQLIIDLASIELKMGNSIRFSFDMESVYEDGGEQTEGSFNGSLDYILNQDYDSVSELAADIDFIQFITTVMTNVFQAGVDFTPPDDGTLTNTPAFSFTNTTNTITITAPVYEYEIDNTPGDPGDDDFTYRTYTWHFLDGTTVNYRNFSVASSVKTNRSVEVGIIYMDEFGRRTTVLTCKTNTIYIPQGNAQQVFSINRNRIKVTLDSPPPVWADRYKFVVKHQPLTYQIVYGIVFYEDGLFRWIKMDGANLDKVDVGDTLIIKSDLGGPLSDIVKVRVLEKTTKDSDFIPDNENEDGEEIIEQQGTYIKVKAPAGVDMSFNSATARTFEGGSHLRYPENTYTEPVFGFYNDSDVYVPYALNAGSTVRIYINFKANGSIAYNVTYDKTFVVNNDYDSVEDWFNAEVIDLGSFGDDYTRGYGFNDDGSQFYVRAHRDGTASRKITTAVRFDILFTDGLLIFETETVNVDVDIYYETQQAFEIVDGYHNGNLQDQNDAQPAMIELDFFDCFVMGNGAECYRVKDTFNSNSLNVDLRPSTASIEEYKAIRRTADLTYGEPYVESANINGLNEFNLSTANFKELDKQIGSVQILASRDNDIVVIQEEGEGRVFFEKNKFYGADGASVLSTVQEVLGDYFPYLGKHGIGKDPESFGYDDYRRMYYVCARKGTVVRLSADGVEKITYGLKDFFRKLFTAQPNALKIGGYDPYLEEYTLSVGEEPVRLSRFQCNNMLMKSGQTEPFSYELQLNNLGGDVILNYNITEGNATIEAEFNGDSYVASNVTGVGNLTFERDSLVENIVVVTITPVSDSITYSIGNSCPTGTELIIVNMVLNDAQDTGQTMTNRFKWTGSPFSSTDDLFTLPPLTRFSTMTGIEGVGVFPANGSLMTIQAFKDTINSGHFATSECNRLGYLITDTIYTSAQYQMILDNPDTVFLTVTETGEEGFSITNAANFIFARTDVDQRLYLIWDYTSRNPVIADDTANVNVGQTVVIDVLANDDVGPDAVVTIGAAPLYGTVVVNEDKTISYTHDGSDNLNDSFTYVVTEGGCSSTATVTINIGISCGDSLSASGSTGIYELNINFGTDTGYCGIGYNAQSVPDRFQLYWDDVLVADSKYVGNGIDPGPPTSYPGLLGEKTLSVYEYNGTGFVDTGVDETFTIVQADIADGSPEEPISGTGIIYFEKTTPLPTTVKLRVTGPVGGTAWSLVDVICPQPEPPTE